MACITLVLDIPIARQVIVFLYLMFIPGLILLRILRLEKSDMIETVLFSIGLSITFLLTIGFLVNELGPLFSISKPLSTEPLVIIISISVLFISILSYFRNEKDVIVTAPKDLRISHLAPYFALPLLGIIGVMFVKAFQNNLLLISIIITISILFVLGSFSKSSSYYPFALVSIALTLLSCTYLISNYINGYDIHLEYYVFMVTKNSSYWNPNLFLFFDQFVDNSVLSLTVLPTIFSNMLNMEGTWIFKILYLTIFAFVPLCLYQLYKTQWGKKVAFMSVLFFLSNLVVFDFRGNVKQMIAEFFYILLFLVLFKKDMNRRSKWVLLMCFGFSLIACHYTMSFIFLILIFSTWLCGKIFMKNNDMKIDSAIVVFFFVLTFSWYVFVVEAPLYRLGLFYEVDIQRLFEGFFISQLRGGAILTATGMLSPPSFLHSIGTILFDATAFFILIGLITLIAKRKKERFNLEYPILAFLNMAPLLMSIIIPNFSSILYTERLYQITLLFLSPLFILGGRTFFENIFKILPLKKEKKREESYSSILILTVLVMFFLFQTGFVYEISGDPVPTSIFLSTYKIDYYSIGMLHENDVWGAIWSSKYADVEHNHIYSDVAAKYFVLTSSMIGHNYVEVLSNTTQFASGSYIYLSRYNTINHILLYDMRNINKIQYNISELPIFNSTTFLNNKIYSNSACEIYYYNPP